MHGNVICLVALDLVLGFIDTRVMDVAFVVHVLRMHPHDMSADPASFGIPGYVIADLECLGHELMILHLERRAQALPVEQAVTRFEAYGTLRVIAAYFIVSFPQSPEQTPIPEISLDGTNPVLLLGSEIFGRFPQHRPRLYFAYD